MAVFAMFGALMYASKEIMAVLPNIHLLGMFTMLLTVVYRSRALYPIYIYALLEGLTWGFPVWWPPHLYIWTLLWGVTMLLPRDMPPRAAMIVYPAVCALHGVFAVRVKGLDGETVFGGAASLGYKPTVASERRWLLETFVFNYSGNAYGRIVEIEFVQKLRDEKKFSGLEELKDAINRDAETARRLLGI